MYITLNEGITNPELDLDIDFAATGEEADVARIVYESAIEAELLQEASMRLSGVCYKAKLTENYETLDMVTEAEAPKFFDRIKTMFENALKKMMAFLKAAFDTVQKFLISDKSFVEKYTELVSKKGGSGSIKMNGHNFGDIDGIDLASLEGKLNGILKQDHFHLGYEDFATRGSAASLSQTAPATKDKLAAAIVAGATASTLREKLADKYVGKAGEVSLSVSSQLDIVKNTKDQIKTISEMKDTIKKSYETTLNEISKKRSELSKVKAEKYEAKEGDDQGDAAQFKKGQINASAHREGSIQFLSLAAEVTNTAKSLMNTTAGFQIAAAKSRRAQAKNAVVKYVHGTEKVEEEKTNESALSQYIWSM